LLTVTRKLPTIAIELEEMNKLKAQELKLKALEIKLKFHGMVEPVPEWVAEVDEILK
jgi:hypothetical protein